MFLLVIFGNKDVLADNQKLEEQKSEVQVQAGENILNFVDYSQDPKLDSMHGTKSEDNSYHTLYH